MDEVVSRIFVALYSDINWNMAGILVGSFLVGFIGSAAYFTALYFKFVGRNDRHREVILQPFLRRDSFFYTKVSFLKVFWYSCMGGFVASIFQYGLPNFVAVQSFIIGATWPGVVSQFLSGRMGELTTDERDALEDARKMDEARASADGSKIDWDKLQGKLKEKSKKSK